MSKITNAIALIALIATFAIIPNLQGKEPTHYCLENGIKMYCDRLSSTGLTCYPNNETRTGSKRCTDGWQEIPNIDNNEVTEPIQAKEQITNSREYRCSDVCVPIK